MVTSSQSLGLSRRTRRTSLIDFLRIDCALGFTFLQTAAIVAESDLAHYKTAVAKSRLVLETAHRFVARVGDPAVRREMNPALISWLPRSARWLIGALVDRVPNRTLSARSQEAIKGSNYH